MCYIFKCFGLFLDLVQRLFTFCLACVLCGSICVGMVVAISAGIAYGYNYSMAEFLTFTRHDTTVYLRRGQLNDKKEITLRRSGEEDRFPQMENVEEDNNQVNGSDYEDIKTKVKALSDLLQKADKSRKYAQKLNTFNGQIQAIPGENQAFIDSANPNPVTPIFKDDPVNFGQMTARGDANKGVVWSGETSSASIYPSAPSPSTQEPKLIERGREFTQNVQTASHVKHAGSPNPMVPTRTVPGRSNIVMRNFKPIALSSSDYYTGSTLAPEVYKDDELYSDGSKTRIHEKRIDKHNRKDEEEPKKFIPMRHWGITKSPISGYTPQEVDEDNIVYRPI